MIEVVLRFISRVCPQRTPTKVYDCFELSYLVEGSMEIIPKEGPDAGKPQLVKTGDFVTFPLDFPCTWVVKEPVLKHYFIYEYEDGKMIDITHDDD